MKRNTTRFLLVMLMVLSLCFLCVACGGGSESAKSTESSTISPQNNPNEGLGGGGSESAKSTESSTISPQNNPNEGLGDRLPSRNESTGNVIGLCKGIWLGTKGNDYNAIEFDAEGEWLLISGEGYIVDEGYLWYDDEWDVTYIYSYTNEAVDDGEVVLDGDELHISTLGYFAYSDGTEDFWQQIGDGENAGPSGNDYNGDADQFYSWDTELRQRNVREFEGVWYYEGDLSAMMYIVIDGYGNWSWYERAVGEAEGAEMDWGTFSYSTDEMSTYYAESYLYDNLTYRVVEYDIDILIWNDSVFYRLG